MPRSNPKELTTPNTLSTLSEVTLQRRRCSRMRAVARRKMNSTQRPKTMLYLLLNNRLESKLTTLLEGTTPILTKLTTLEYDSLKN